MKLKEIEGVRIAAGETLVVVPSRPLSDHQVTMMGDAAKKAGIKILILPNDTKVYVQEKAS